MEFRRVVSTSTPDYAFVERLMEVAFPAEERRERAAQRLLTDSERRFSCHVVCDGGEPVGFVTWWNFDDFRYVEHFAMSPGVRNRGYGARVMERILDMRPAKPTVLEVELPENDMARRRVGFYERQGFELWPDEYSQPPYSAAGCWVPMRMMAYGNLTRERDFARVRDSLYRTVYGVPAER
ncbi:MAG: GNAT family N-acetyltransferase [Alistipes sp.]|nr:GNAT family N-acetyltransferase [Alistipes sp.]